MIINLILFLVLIWFVIHNFIKAHRFVEFSGWHDLFIPVYSILLFVVTMKWDREDLMMLAILLPVALLTGWFETKGIEIRKEFSDKKNDYEYKIKKGTPYALGWTFTFILGIVIHFWFSREAILEMFSEAIWDNILEEINPFAIFSTTHTWYIWFLSGVSSLTFIMIIKLAIRKMVRERQTKEDI